MPIVDEAGVRAAFEHFALDGTITDIEINRTGRINDTFVITMLRGDGIEQRYYLQKINSNVFKQPLQVAHNQFQVTQYLKKIIVRRNGDPFRETLTYYYTRSGKKLHINRFKEYWRVTLGVENSISYNEATPELFYEAAKAFGRFQRDLKDFPAKNLYETIPGFHDTPSRFKAFQDSVNADVVNRVSTCKELIDEILSYADFVPTIQNMLNRGEISLRVTHNDTKLNNVLLDKDTGKGLCVVDLDTIMPGVACFDFGDAVRYGANTASEDERDLSKVSLDLELFDAFAKGFLEGLEGSLSNQEIASCVPGSQMMAFELAIRFLKDYLDGDKYFGIVNPDDNLARALVQWTLFKDMKKKEKEMYSILEKYNK